MNKPEPSAPVVLSETPPDLYGLVMPNTQTTAASRISMVPQLFVEKSNPSRGYVIVGAVKSAFHCKDHGSPLDQAMRRVESNRRLLASVPVMPFFQPFLFEDRVIICTKAFPVHPGCECLLATLDSGDQQLVEAVRAVHACGIQLGLVSPHTFVPIGGQLQLADILLPGRTSDTPDDLLSQLNCELAHGGHPLPSRGLLSSQYPKSRHSIVEQDIIDVALMLVWLNQPQGSPQRCLLLVARDVLERRHVFTNHVRLAGFLFELSSGSNSARGLSLDALLEPPNAPDSAEGGDRYGTLRTKVARTPPKQLVTTEPSERAAPNPASAETTAAEAPPALATPLPNSQKAQELDPCCLADVKVLPAGDETEIGEKLAVDQHQQLSQETDGKEDAAASVSEQQSSLQETIKSKIELVPQVNADRFKIVRISEPIRTALERIKERVESRHPTTPGIVLSGCRDSPKLQLASYAAMELNRGLVLLPSEGLPFGQIKSVLSMEWSTPFILYLELDDLTSEAAKQVASWLIDYNLLKPVPGLTLVAATSDVELARSLDRFETLDIPMPNATERRMLLEDYFEVDDNIMQVLVKATTGVSEKRIHAIFATAVPNAPRVKGADALATALRVFSLHLPNDKQAQQSTT